MCRDLSHVEVNRAKWGHIQWGRYLDQMGQRESWPWGQLYFCDILDVTDGKQQIWSSSSSWGTDPECWRLLMSSVKCVWGRKWACLSADMFYDVWVGWGKHGRCKEFIFRPCGGGVQDDWRKHCSIKSADQRKRQKHRQTNTNLDCVLTCWTSREESGFPRKGIQNFTSSPNTRITEKKYLWRIQRD